MLNKIIKKIALILLIIVSTFGWINGFVDMSKNGILHTVRVMIFYNPFTTFKRH